MLLLAERARSSSRALGNCRQEKTFRLSRSRHGAGAGKVDLVLELKFQESSSFHGLSYKRDSDISLSQSTGFLRTTGQETSKSMKFLLLVVIHIQVCKLQAL